MPRINGVPLMIAIRAAAHGLKVARCAFEVEQALEGASFGRNGAPGVPGASSPEEDLAL